MSSNNNDLKKIILTELKKYQEKSYSDLITEFKLQYKDKLPKNIGYIISNAIVKRIEQENKISFDNFFIKSVRINDKNTPLQSMSFSQINYNEIINEDWCNSNLNKVFNTEFLFFIFKYNNKEATEPIFISSQFWKMNSEDFDLVNKFWELTKDNILRGDYNNFITIKNNFICHVRTKGINSQDLILTPQGTYQTKRSFWLNASYIKSQIKNEYFYC